VTKQAIGKLIAACERRGLVRTITDPTDRRAKVVLFTQQSREVILAERAVIRRIDDQLRKRLGDTAFTSLRASITIVADSSDAQLGTSRTESEFGAEK